MCAYRLEIKSVVLAAAILLGCVATSEAKPFWCAALATVETVAQ